jgi:hypothetical protein
MNDHLQRPVFIQFEVDEELYPLLKELWKIGLKTEYSCQGGWCTSSKGVRYFTLAYIVFFKIVDAKKFYSIVEKLGDINLSFEPREITWGGGACVRFSPELISEITEYIKNMSNSSLNYYKTLTT